MSNKIQLRTNNTTLSTLIDRVNNAKDVASTLPDADSGGGGNATSVALVVKTRKTPMTSSLVSRIIDVEPNTDGGGFGTRQEDNPIYLHTIQPICGTFIHFKTQNSPSKCTLNNTGLELVEFDATTGAIVKVLDGCVASDMPDIVFS